MFTVATQRAEKIGVDVMVRVSLRFVCAIAVTLVCGCGDTPSPGTGGDSGGDSATEMSNSPGTGNGPGTSSSTASESNTVATGGSVCVDEDGDGVPPWADKDDNDSEIQEEGIDDLVDAIQVQIQY